MTTFHNFALRIETGWAKRVVKSILKIRNVISRSRSLIKHVQ